MAENMSRENAKNNFPMVYLYEIGILGELIQYNAHASIVRYSMNGLQYQTTILNEDFEIVQELDLGIDYYE